MSFIALTTVQTYLAQKIYVFTSFENNALRPQCVTN